MLTRDQIKNNLKKDPFWEPNEDATEEEWDLFEEVYEELDQEKDVMTPRKPKKSKEDDTDDLPEDFDDLDELDELEDLDEELDEKF